MALPSTMYSFEVALSDVDRAVYEQLAIKAAWHPSESADHLLTRVIAYCLEYREGIAFSRGIADVDEPAITVRDLTGAWISWIEVGAPDAARLHFASKASPRVVLYTHKEPRIVMQAYEGQRIHRADEVEVYAVDRGLLDSLAQHLGRRTAWAMSVADRQLYVDVGGISMRGSIERLALPG